jgi:hypothetical protein
MSFWYEQYVDEDELPGGGAKFSKKKNCRSIPLSTTNVTWTDLGSSPGVRHETQANKCLKQITAFED